MGRQVEKVHFKLISRNYATYQIVLEKTPGYEGLGHSCTFIFNLRKTPGGDYNFDSDLILFPFSRG